MVSQLDFKFDGYCWALDVAPTDWNKFAKTDSVPLIFASEGRDESALTESEVELVIAALEGMKAQQKPIVQRILDMYPEFRDQYYSDFNLDENEDKLPKKINLNSLPEFVTFERLFVHQVHRNGIPYVGYEFSNTWDDEHGLGMQLIGNRIVLLGGADVSSLLWVAEEDLQSHS